ncbi:MAG: hypothetical protein ABI910_18380 [Gemmatimonadota bacterium]
MLRRLTVALLVAAPLTLPGIVQAQGDSLPPRTRLGLAAVSAVSVNVGFASIQRGYHGLAIGTTVDFGHLMSSRIRLLADVGYLHTFPKTEFVQSENRSYRDVFRDLTGTLALSLHPNAPSSRFSPYAETGLGIHILSSSFGTLAVDRRYNTNNFGILLGGGARLRLGSSGRRALLVEVRRVLSQDVGRTSVHVGLAALFGELAPR